jgi:hypothetical protein
MQPVFRFIPDHRLRRHRARHRSLLRRDGRARQWRNLAFGLAPAIRRSFDLIGCIIAAILLCDMVLPHRHPGVRDHHIGPMQPPRRHRERWSILAPFARAASIKGGIADHTPAGTPTRTLNFINPAASMIELTAHCCHRPARPPSSPGKSLAVLDQRQQICHNLAGMREIRQPVDDRNTRELCHILDLAVVIGPDDDGIDHSATARVTYRRLFRPGPAASGPPP